jgi:hypothetical protein
MTVAITIEHNEARLAGTLAFLDAGPNPARLRIYGGTRPATPATVPSSAMLVEIKLTKPAGTISGGLLMLTQQEDGLITATGVAAWARLVNGNDVNALDLDCSGTDGEGDVKLASTSLYLGGDARMVSAILG